MRKPAHALPTAPMMAVTVFEKGKRNALFEATGTDPAHIAATVSRHQTIGEGERKFVRTKVRAMLDAFADRAIPNMTDAQLDVGGRRIRIKIAA